MALEATMPSTTYTPRWAESYCQRALDEGKVLVLVGARQTGKSTLARHLVAEVPADRRLILNLDDPFLRDRLTSQEGALVRAIEAQAQRPFAAIERFWLVVDEAQKAPAIFELIKLLVDAESERLRVILTGSSSLELHDPVAETLAGRARVVHLAPFTYSEAFAHARGVEPAADPLPDLVRRLLNGDFGAAELAAFDERARWSSAERRSFVEAHLRFPLFPEPSGSSTPEEWVRDYLATYVEKDVRSLAAVGNVALFRAAIQALAARAGGPVKWEAVASEIGTTSTTLRRYAGLMEQTFTLLHLGAHAVNPVTRSTRAPKLYPADPGLLWGLRGFEDVRLLEATGMLGTYMEGAAVTEVAKWCALLPTAPTLTWWRKSEVSEVDLVVSNRGYTIPFEIKLGRAVERRWLRGLDAFEADHARIGLHVPYRVILHQGEPTQVDARTVALPLWGFA
jgi:predicted AAA+ superfamily ATPase